MYFTACLYFAVFVRPLDSAAVIYFDVFSSQSITTTTELNDLQITATLTQNLNSVDMLLLNSSTFTTPVITQIAIDDNAGLLSSQPSIANNQFSTFFEANNTKVSGANNIAFERPTYPVPAIAIFI